jgi:hypothetical protein
MTWVVELRHRLGVAAIKEQKKIVSGKARSIEINDSFAGTSF